MQQQNSTTLQQVNDQHLINSLVIGGDIGKLNPDQKIQYYTGYCQRLGLDPFTQPFKLLRLNGKEVLYLDRGGAQQLNKLHNVSHRIVAREITNNCYVVTAEAYTMGGRNTASIGAVSIDGLKGEALCNAMMKAETKAKRRATLDLLGLGVLDETETETIQGAQNVDWQMPVTGGQQNDSNRQSQHSSAAPQDKFKTNYNNPQNVVETLKQATTLSDVVNLYYTNQTMVDVDSNLKAKFSEKKVELSRASLEDANNDVF